MINEKELRTFFEDLENILIDIHICIFNCERLSKEKLEYEQRIKKHGFFHHFFFQQKFVAVIQLFKLFSESKSDKRRFEKLFNILENDNYSESLNLILSDNSKYGDNFPTNKKDIKAIVRELKEEAKTHESIIVKIRTLRSKVYAHKDVNVESVSLKIDELITISKLAAKIFNRLKLCFFYQETEFEYTDHFSIEYILENLNELFKIDDEVRKARIKAM
jgi:hypothetical protein